MNLVNQFKIPKFKGIYMRDGLPKVLKSSECGIMNLDLESGDGTHWTCWYKHKDTCYYFDSFGLTPPDEFYRYMKVKGSVCDPPTKNIYHNTYEIQQRNDVICGHLCVLVLYLLGKSFGNTKGARRPTVDTFHEILYFLYKNKDERKYFWSK